MTYLHQLMCIAIGLALLAAIVISAVNKHKFRKHRDFTRSLETLLQPKETVKVICQQKDFRCILTNTRIIFEKKGDFTAFPIKSVTKVQGLNEKGNRTTVPANMKSLAIKIDKEYVLQNTGDEFLDFVKQLTKKTNPVKSRKEERK